MYILLALLLLGVLIMGHEAGHYFAARACGVEVQEFAMGMGPLLAKWTNKAGTQFSLRALPIGGYCQFYDEDDPRAMNRHAVWKRAMMTISGPAMNFAVALLAIVLYLSALGLLSSVPRVAAMEENAAQAGLVVGDTIVAVNGTETADADAVLAAISQSGGGSVTLRVDRSGEEMDIRIAPFYDAAYDRYRVGFTFAQERLRVPLVESVPFSVRYNIESVKMVVDTLKNILFKGEGVDEMTGPVGTVYVIQEVTRQGGVDIYLELLALISVNLGVMNLLPIPGLDGSRMLFLLAEAVRGKPVNRELEGAIHGAGMLLLMALAVMLTYKDVMRFFVG